jgi:hypothetical protein
LRYRALTRLTDGVIMGPVCRESALLSDAGDNALTGVGLALLAALGMVAVDARGRPVLASVACSITVFVTVSTTLARMPAFAQSLPSVPETALAAAGTVLAGVAGGVLAREAVEQLQGVLVGD